MEMLKQMAIGLVKLGAIGLLVFYFVKADISVQIVLTYLLYMFVERSSQITALEEKTAIQSERIDELEIRCDEIKKY